MTSISQEYQSRSDNSLFLGNTPDSSNVQRLNLLSNKFDKLVKTGQKKGLINDLGSITTKGKYKQQSGRSRAFGDPINIDSV